MKNILAKLLVTGCFFAAATGVAHSQCMTYPVSLNERIDRSASIVSGRITEKTCYEDPQTGLIYTANKVVVQAWLKNPRSDESLYLITEGGVVGNKATLVQPSLQVQAGNEYVFFLEADNHRVDNKIIRSQTPSQLQVKAYADGQGALVNSGNIYRDLLAEAPQDEQTLFNKIASRTGQLAKTPDGQTFMARPLTVSSNRLNAITGISPSTTHAGTINPSDFITITGSGFGASPGTVFFSNGDDGGATFTASGLTSDIISWADGSITVKVPTAAGTGPINVNGSFTSPGNLTIDYSHLSVQSSFNGFGSTTRQRYNLRNLNGTGGYTFLYNTSFNANAAAVASFERALETWRCAAGINFVASGTTASAAVVADGINIVFFDAGLPSGVLGRASSQFTGSATGACNLENTVWWLTGVDVQFMPDPPVSGFPWQYGPAAPAFSEFDFESVSVHELGHALGLGHRISPGDVMHYAISNGTSARTPSATEITAANAKMAYSTAATCFDPAAAGTPMTAASCSTLPLTLLEFSGQLKKENIALSWSTSFEQNTRYFEVEKSIDGSEFYFIGKRDAAGNSNRTIQYAFSDEKLSEYNYYRLKTIDLDGEFEYSRVILIRNPAASQQVWVLNNPFRNNLTVRMAKVPKENVRFELIDVSGKRVFVTEQTASGSYSFDLSGRSLGKGVYILRSQVDGVLYTNKLVKE